ncbi:uncharacterized protein LOC123865143 [Maniola jurtina]|uniref:uncharacterized protein LOC123865143 n=1 Tax=Maniola jurtina TaxID=191418 RepID=UPI001E68BBE0|nr:uncharacterized protein LOC123865143 [Maniola jurtina]
MTSTAAIVIAFSLLIYELTLLPNSSTLIKGEHPESKLVFLLTLCLLLKGFPLCPGIIARTTFFPACLLVEIPLSLTILESSLIYVWKPLQEYLLLYSDDILVHLYEDTRYMWLVCPLCCGKSGCNEIFTNLVLKVMSFVFLITICFALKNKA